MDNQKVLVCDPFGKRMVFKIVARKLIEQTATIITAPTNGPQFNTKKGKQRKYSNRTVRIKT